MKALFVALFLLLSNNGIYANDFPPPFTAEYKVYAKGFSVGKGTRTLKRLKNGKYLFKTVAETTGFISFFKKIRIEEQSIFTRTKSGTIRPLKYTYRQKNGSKKRTNEVIFYWGKGMAKNTFKGETKMIALQEGTLDRLLYQLVLMQDLKQGKRKLKYIVADRGEIKVYTPKFLGNERVETGMGKLNSLKYMRVSNNRRTTLWCARALHYLPVQVEHVEDGDVFSMLLQSVRKID